MRSQQDDDHHAAPSSDKRLNNKKSVNDSTIGNLSILPLCPFLCIPLFYVNTTGHSLLFFPSNLAMPSVKCVFLSTVDCRKLHCGWLLFRYPFQSPLMLCANTGYSTEGTQDIIIDICGPVCMFVCYHHRHHPQTLHSDLIDGHLVDRINNSQPPLLSGGSINK